MGVTYARSAVKVTTERVYVALAVVLMHSLLAIATLRTAQIAKREATAPPEIRLVPVSTNPGGTRGRLLDSQNGVSTCLQGKSYKGIGLQFDLDQIVTVAPVAYPAFKAGIRPGDIIANPDFEPDADGYDVVEFTRRGKHHRLRIMTQWICLQ